MLTDRFARSINYLRLSLTDLCNLRCLYCMPLDAATRDARSEILSFEEIERLVTILAGLGVTRVRLTGGEPLVRRDLPRLIERLCRVHGIAEVLLTTNGILLKDQARALRDAGLKKINIHFDTLNPETFRKITRWGDLTTVLEGIDEAQAVGLAPIKINAVMQRGLNDHEAGDLLRFAASRGFLLRLIELMPIGEARNQPKLYIPLSEIKEWLDRDYTLTVSGCRFGHGPALYYKVEELGAFLGMISPVSRPFCRNCNRIRISADGRFQDCLAFDGTLSLRDLLRDPTLADEDIAGEIAALIGGKRESHEGFIQVAGIRTPCMNGIGG